MADQTAAGQRATHAYNRDNAFFRDGLEQGVFRIQRCTSCNALRHPPRPMCPQCHSFEWDTIDACGRGQIYSYAVHHHPPLPGIEMPGKVVLVELEEGVRSVGNLVQANEDALRIDAPVQMVIEADAQGSLLVNWRPAESDPA